MGGMGDEGAGERGFAAPGGGEVPAQSWLGSRNEKHSARFLARKVRLKATFTRISSGFHS